MQRRNRWVGAYCDECLPRSLPHLNLEEKHTVQVMLKSMVDGGDAPTMPIELPISSIGPDSPALRALADAVRNNDTIWTDEFQVSYEHQRTRAQEDICKHKDDQGCVLAELAQRSSEREAGKPEQVQTGSADNPLHFLGPQRWECGEDALVVRVAGSAASGAGRGLPAVQRISDRPQPCAPAAGADDAARTNQKVDPATVLCCNACMAHMAGMLKDATLLCRHQDTGGWVMVSHRVHVPIIGNQDVRCAHHTLPVNTTVRLVGRISSVVIVWSEDHISVRDFPECGSNSSGELPVAIGQPLRTACRPHYHRFEVMHPTKGFQLIDVSEGRIFELNNVYAHQVSNEGCAQHDVSSDGTGVSQIPLLATVKHDRASVGGADRTSASTC